MWFGPPSFLVSGQTADGLVDLHAVNGALYGSVLRTEPASGPRGALGVRRTSWRPPPCAVPTGRVQTATAHDGRPKAPAAQPLARSASEAASSKMRAAAAAFEAELELLAAASAAAATRGAGDGEARRGGGRSLLEPDFSGAEGLSRGRGGRLGSSRSASGLPAPRPRSQALDEIAPFFAFAKRSRKTEQLRDRRASRSRLAAEPRAASAAPPPVPMLSGRPPKSARPKVGQPIPLLSTMSLQLEQLEQQVRASAHSRKSLDSTLRRSRRDLRLFEAAPAAAADVPRSPKAERASNASIESR